MTKLLVAVLVLSLSSSLSLIAQMAPNQAEAVKAAVAGYGIDSESANALESILAGNPNDLIARAKLIGYYTKAKYGSPEATMKLRENVLWLIRNAPETEVAAVPYCKIDWITDREGYAQGKQLWQEQVESHPDRVQILDHAAQFFLLGDKELAESYLKRAQQLDPANPRWFERLGQLYSLRGGTADAASSFSEYEKAQTADSSGMTRYYRLASLSKSAYAAGEIDKASQYAIELLQLAEQYPKDWNYGNAIHHGNNILGLVTLWRGDVEGSKQYLLKAGQTPGSPQLNSFGSNMSLAKALIEKGERDTVLRFFDLCREFWKLDRNSLNNWADEVKAGKTPNFSANLKY